MSAKSKSSKDNKPQRKQEANLGQKEAEREHQAESELSHMGGSRDKRAKDD
jgi:hypothetical protein